MKQINLVEFIELLNNPNDLGDGNTLFRKSYFDETKISHDNDISKYEAIIESNKSSLRVNNGFIDAYECSCDAYTFNKKVCKHIVCLINIHNECCNHHLGDLSNWKDAHLSVKAVIYENDNKEKQIKVLFQFANENYNTIDVRNIKKLFEKENEFTIFLNYSLKKEQITEMALDLINDVKQVLIDTNSMVDQSFVDVKNEHLHLWINFLKKHQIGIYYKDENSWITLDNNTGYNNYLWEHGGKVSVNNKKRFSIKNVKDLNIFALYSDNKNYLFVYSQKNNIISLYQYDQDKEAAIRDFVKKFQKQLTKNEMSILYGSLKSLFSNYNEIVPTVDYVKMQLGSIDPVLEAKVYTHKELEVIVFELNFLYGEKAYPFELAMFDKIDIDKYNREKRKITFEKELAKEFLPFIDYYNAEFNVFEIINSDKWAEFQKFGLSKSNDENFSFVTANDVLFKEKKKKKFIVQGAKLENELFKVNWTIEGFGPEDVLRIIKAYIEKKKFVKLSSDRQINIEYEIDMDSFKEKLRMLNTSLNDIQNDLSVNVSLFNAKFFAESYKDLIDKDTNDKINQLFDINSIKVELPDNLKNILKSYQLTGYKWFKKLLELNAGGILADDMGLGKTIQSISLLSDIYFNKKTDLPTLIVCPNSLVYNWIEEIHKFAPFIKSTSIDGSKEERKAIYEKINQFNVVVISYNTLLKDIEEQAFKNNFYLQIIDEAQKIKNFNSSTYETVSKIRANYKIALTGTPIENSLSELWSIVNYALPGYLGEYRTFKQDFEYRINEDDKEALEKLKKKIAPFVLRRTKSDVLHDLPPKTTKVLTYELSDEQKDLYFSELHKIKADYASKWKNDKQHAAAQILNVLTRLRQICCSPKLIFENAQSNGKKFQECMDLVQTLIAQKSKILIFSQFVKMIEILDEELKRRKIKHVILSGNVKAKERAELVKHFNENENVKVFLVSLKAGGVGLTLTSADTVIHYDPWWNGSLEDQATDRAHRIGQKRNVTVYKLVTKDSIEEKVLKLQETKKEMFKKVFSDLENVDFASASVNKTSLDELKTLLELED